jgi:hypothetical protein
VLLTTARVGRAVSWPGDMAGLTLCGSASRALYIRKESSMQRVEHRSRGSRRGGDGMRLVWRAAMRHRDMCGPPAAGHMSLAYG